MILTGVSNAVEGVIQLFVVLIMFLFVLALAYLAARFAGRFQSNIQSRSNVRTIETARIGNNKYIQIVKIGSRYFAIGVGKDDVTFLTELKEEELNLDALNNNTKGSFKDILSQLQKKKDENDTDET
ncbi:MAG: flagellar biosynthetic protein FliO [Lachnospiraceae bacterium]|nr:flagellar biosynthetic protein FliO [Lachnospiraceae bacterium]MBP3507215.1 flagellar biosynthetic protein FliO [Lachnospiraceae bacterium]